MAWSREKERGNDSEYLTSCLTALIPRWWWRAVFKLSAGYVLIFFNLLVRLQSGVMTPPRGAEYPSPLATFIVKTFANNSINWLAGNQKACSMSRVRICARACSIAAVSSCTRLCVFFFALRPVFFAQNLKPERTVREALRAVLFNRMLVFTSERWQRWWNTRAEKFN